MALNDLKVVTYNCHGFNQGLTYLKDLLCYNDIICIQEHWLCSKDLPNLAESSSIYFSSNTNIFTYNTTNKKYVAGTATREADCLSS